MYPPTVMAIENIIPKPSNSSYQDVSIVARASRMVLALDWKEPVYINTLLVICIAFLIQSALKSRKRMRRLEEEVRDVVEKWNDMERQIDELREEMRISREEDREEKLCLVENVKQVMRQRTLSPDRGSESNDIDTGFYQRSDATTSSSEDLVDDERNDVVQRLPEDDTSCPWCSHAHLLKLGDCAGDDTCDGSVHIPYCPSCFYNEKQLHGQVQQELHLNDGTTTAAETASKEVGTESLDD